MKILIVSWFFPPANTIGAVRLGNAAKFLLDRGHDVQMLAGKDLPYERNLVIDLPGERIRYAKWADISALPGIVKAAVRRGAALGAAPGIGPETGPRDEPGAGPKTAAGDSPAAGAASRSIPGAAVDRLRDFYFDLTNIPDKRVGWYPYAVRAGKELLDTWRPDLVFASGPPFTTLLVGYTLSRRYGLPLVLEIRDRWSDDPYYPPPPWRRWIDRLLERRTVARASGITTVSPPWAATYRTVYGKPVAVVFNGYDAELCPATPSRGSDDLDALRIVYTGGIYPGRRDPSPLFQAVKALGADARKVRVEFYGTDPDLVLPLARPHGVTDRVVVHPPVTHEEAVERQRNADILLLMQWNDPREQGNVPGKFFEYLGALRPILVLGLNDGVPATIVRERGAGFHSNDPARIAAQLAEWIAEKEANGHVAPLPESARRGFSRDEQYEELERFLGDIARSAGRPTAPAGAD